MLKEKAQRGCPRSRVTTCRNSAVPNLLSCRAMASCKDKIIYKTQNDLNIEREHGQSATVNMDINNASQRQMKDVYITARQGSSPTAARETDHGIQRQYSRQTSNPADRDVCVVLPKRLNSVIDNSSSSSSGDPLLLQKHVSRQSSRSPDKCRQSPKYPSPCFIRQISKNTSNVIKIIVVVSLLLNICLIPAFATVITLLLRDTTSCSVPQPPAVGLDVSDSLCFPCGVAGIPGVPGAVRTDNGVCCGSKEDADLQRILKQRVLPATAALVHTRTPCTVDSVEEPSKKGPRRKHSLKTAAHLLVDVKETQTAGSIKWMTESADGIAFLQGGLTVGNSTIRVKKGGIYRISSHFSLDTFKNRLVNPKYIMNHYIYKASSGETSVIKLVKTVLVKRMYESSDVVVGVVKLRDGDEIGVEMQTYQYLYNMEVANTLDIEKIG